MLFTQLEFFIFFPLIFLFTYFCASNLVQKRFLLLASYYFYGYWDWRFLGLILFSTIVDYWIGIHLAKCRKERKLFFLLISLFTNLGLLGFFKYYNFFVESFNTSLAFLNINLEALNIILPVGISFYTFQTLSYSIDIYRKRLCPSKNFFDFALYVSFFPQLVAGPIVRATDLLPQFENERNISLNDIFEGAKQFIFGLFKKVFIADRLAFFVDRVFENYSVFDSLTIWLAVICYAIQIYCDFSGYSDMAIGVARMLGFKFNINFNLPYIATNIKDFWHRWHISLSTWLRDYLYIPLGGNRKGKLRLYLNLLITMTLGGLWHGASWNFVIWGLWHGLALVITTLVADLNIINKYQSNKKILSLGGWVLTMITVLIGWVFFRSKTTEQAISILKKMFSYEEGIQWFYGFAVVAFSMIFLQHLINFLQRSQKLLELKMTSLVTPIVLFTMLWLVIIFYPENKNPFIYFQF